MKSKVLMAILIASFLIFPTSGQAKSPSTNDTWTNISNLATKTTQAVENGETKAGLTFLDAFSKAWESAQTNSNIKLTDVQSRTLNATIENMKNDINNQADPIKLKRDAVEFNLAVDALSPDGTPIWLSMGDQLTSALDTAIKDVQAGNDTKFQVDFNQFLDLYQMVYPSMAIDVPANQLNKVEGTVISIMDHRMIVLQNKTSAVNELQTLNKNLKTIFVIPNQSVDALPTESLNSMILSVGSLIILTLFYVSWKKYRGSVTPTN